MALWSTQYSANTPSTPKPRPFLVTSGQLNTSPALQASHWPHHWMLVPMKRIPTGMSFTSLPASTT